MTTKEKILDLAEKMQHPPSWLWKVLGGAIFVILVLWIRYLLTKRSDELGRLKGEIAVEKLKAEQLQVNASVESDTNKRQIAEGAAVVALNNAHAAEAHMAKLEAEHRAHVAQLQAVSDKDWAKLNELAGVKVLDTHDPLETLK